MTAAERSRQWREQRTAAGRCLRCPQFVEDGHTECRQCRLETSHQRAAWMRSLRQARDFIDLMILLAENRCVECGEAKDYFDPWRHRKCEKVRAA